MKVFDFDGTATKPTKEGHAAYMAAHQAGFAKLLGYDPAWAAEQYAVARHGIVANPDQHGWIIGGQIVAPALVDAFVEAQVCAQIILHSLGHDLAAWEERLNALYQEHYLLYETQFRAEMLETFEILREQGVPFYIVTNSDPDKVRKRLDGLGAAGEWLKPLVYGHARKYVVTPGRPELLPAHTRFHGLERPIALHKGYYYDVLAELLAKHGKTWGDLTVIGDIAELDLIMAVSLGARGLLMVSRDTPAHELRWAEDHERVRLIDDLRSAIAPFAS